MAGDPSQALRLPCGLFRNPSSVSTTPHPDSESHRVKGLGVCFGMTCVCLQKTLEEPFLC